MRARVLLLAAAMLCVCAQAHAETDAWDGIEVIDDAEMGELRGGLAVGPNLDINFGAVVTTFANGVPALSTQLNWTNVGPMVEQTVGAIGQNIADLAPEARTAMGLDGLENAGGVVIEDEAGVTALVHNITEGSLQNIIINNAAGRDLSQTVDVTLTLPGFEVMQSLLNVERFGIRINSDMQAALAGMR